MHDRCGHRENCSYPTALYIRPRLMKSSKKSSAMSVRPIRRQNPDGGRQEGNNKETSQLPLSQETRGCDEVPCSKSTDRALIFLTIKKSTKTYFYEEKCGKDVFAINDCFRLHKSHEEKPVFEAMEHFILNN